MLNLLFFPVLLTLPALADNEECKKELVDKVSTLVTRKFGKDEFQGAFEHFDKNSDKKIDSNELKTLLAEAGIGNFFTRGFWVEGILKDLDENGDHAISWEEFEKGLEGGTSKEKPEKNPARQKTGHRPPMIAS